MPDIGEDGLFVGLSSDEKATRVLNALKALDSEQEASLQQLMDTTEMTENQVHTGIRHLREAKGEHCVVTKRRGALSTYKLAENAPEVRDYAITRFKNWRTQIDIMRKEMNTARELLSDGDSAQVRVAIGVMGGLLEILDGTEEIRLEQKRKEDAIRKRELKVEMEREKLRQQARGRRHAKATV